MSLTRIESPSGLRFSVTPDGSIERIELGDVTLNTYPGTELEGGPANVYLRRLDGALRVTPLLGPRSPAAIDLSPGRLVATGLWEEIVFHLELRLAHDVPAWFWHVTLSHTGARAARVDLVHAQDLSLAHYGAIRNNEYYVSQYVDWTPLEHPARGVVLAARQNLAMGGRYPWALVGTLGRSASFATDALQLYGRGARTSRALPGLVAERLEGRRLQHEHAMAVLQHAPIVLEPKRSAASGFFGCFAPDHTAASSPVDLAVVDATLALPEARTAVGAAVPTALRRASASVFGDAEALETHDLDADEIDRLFSRHRRHEEQGEGGILSFFHGADRHVVLRAKECLVLRPHGQILRTGRALVPDEAALSSTVWMCGVFNSLLTQGHVNINRFVSATHGYLGLFRSDGQRVFVETRHGLALLDLPSAFEMSPNACRWIYKHEGGVLEVRTAAALDRHEIDLSLVVLAGPPVRFLVSTRIALGGDDGAAHAPALWARDGAGVVVRPPADSDVGRRFPAGSFRMQVVAGVDLARAGGDELLYRDGKARGGPFVVLGLAPTRSATLRITGHLVTPEAPADSSAIARDGEAEAYWRRCAGAVTMKAPPDASLAEDVSCLGELLPWLARDALVHYLAPHGLEQYAGGGWGTRDVCQGPVELLLALGEHAVLRDLLLRVFANQNTDGDWPQWFMFFARERSIRAPDSHGDIVFWPLLALGEYLVASEDASVLAERVPFYDAAGDASVESGLLAAHVERALDLITRRVVLGTRLAAYGNGDWNDSLQPVDPAMKERLTSSWTVTLHFQTLRTLAAGLRAVGHDAEAEPLERAADAVRDDFRRRLIRGGVVAGLASFDDAGREEALLHPSDRVTGISYSLLPMIHGILWDVFTPEEAWAHRALIREHLVGADGARLFDAPVRYHGGPQRYFQRAESSSFFGREIGVMYTHAHLRYAEAMARLGEGDAFLLALRQANPIGLAAVVPSARPRQANCYYSSSDAEFADRYEASARYDAVKTGEVAFEGGWRVYSSGAGIAHRLIHERFLGIERRRSSLVVDPVLPVSLDGLEADVTLCGRRIKVRYRTGRKGAGPVAISLDGQPLAFERVDNPYRRGAAKLSLHALEGALRRDGAVLEVTLE